MGLAVCTALDLGHGYTIEEVWEYVCTCWTLAFSGFVACNGCSIDISLGGTSCPESEHPVLKWDIPECPVMKGYVPS